MTKARLTPRRGVASSLENLRKIELRVEDKTLGEQYHTWQGNGWFSASSSLAAGTHYGTYFGSDISNTLVQENFTFTVPSGCSAPSTAGVHICWPTNGASINATSVVVDATSVVVDATSVVVDATSTITGTMARMEVWVDGVKKYTETNSTSVSAAVEVMPGTHTFTVLQ